MTLGQLGENAAEEYLKTKDYNIVTRNFRTRMGEIDIVCKKNGTFVFVEVKSRVGDIKGKPYEAVNKIKLAHLKKAIYYFLIKNKIHDSKLRIDVVSIEFFADRSINSLRHFENVDL